MNEGQNITEEGLGALFTVLLDELLEKDTAKLLVKVVPEELHQQVPQGGAVGLGVEDAFYLLGSFGLLAEFVHQHGQGAPRVNRVNRAICPAAETYDAQENLVGRSPNQVLQ